MEKGRSSLEWGGGERGRPSFLYGFLLFKGKAETALVKGVVRKQRHLGSLGGGGKRFSQRYGARRRQTSPLKNILKNTRTDTNTRQACHGPFACLNWFRFI